MKVAALVRSNKGDKSTSASMMSYLEKQLKPHSIPVSHFYARSMYKDHVKREQFIAHLQSMVPGDLVIVCAPDYVDSLPAPLINLMEAVLDTLGPGSLSGIKLLAVIHSGYPEPQQRKPSLESCRFFANTMGMQWCGGLGFGGTSPINGQPLEKTGLFGKKLLPVFNRTASRIASGELMKTEELVLEELSLIPVPTWMIPMMLNATTKRKARKEGQDLCFRPYNGI